MANFQDITIALAGACQACGLVTQLANTGNCSPTGYQNAINSILNTNPSSALNTFGDLTDIQPGLHSLITLVGQTEKEDLPLIRYVFSALSLADKLGQNKEALNQISTRLAHISQHRPESSESDEFISTALSGIYSDIISPLSNKIKVTGRIECLQSPYIQAKIRTALFAAIRAGILWRQVGGTRLNLFFSRKKILKIANELLVAR